MKFCVYTDGACKGNPGIGGWGAVFLFLDEKGKEQCGLSLKGGSKKSTNNRMELMAAIRALEAIEAPSEVDLYTDSSYVQKGITEWIQNWVKKNWKSASGSPVLNQDLWKMLLLQQQRHQVRFHWVKGHANNLFNHRADALANQAVEEIKSYLQQSTNNE